MSANKPDRPIYTPPGGPPRVTAPDSAIFASMGEDNIAAMIHDFYAELAQSAIAGLFPDDMTTAAADKSAAFFIGLLGGPPRYHQRYGSPMMRARHMPFRIDEAARQTWLACFDRVLAHAPQRYAFPAEHLTGFREFLAGFSSWMVNTAPDTDDG